VSATTTERPDVEAYLAAVRRELADLSPTERDELLADVETSLLDAAEESDAPIAARLGPPGDFAAELRAAAGLASREPAASPKRRSLTTLWRAERAVPVKRTLLELAPLWWVARGYVVVALVAWVVDSGWSASVPVVPRLRSPETGLLLVLLAVTGSVALGLWQRRRSRARTLSLALNLILALAAVPAAGDLLERLSNRPYAEPYYVPDPAPPTVGVVSDGVQVENIYPYSRDGRLLLDVLLYDQFGRPIEIRPVVFDPDRRVLRTANRRSVFNSFPIRYFEPGTRRVARPRAAPAIPWSSIETPPLRRKPATNP
jgi:hypothetical protein